MDALNKIVRVRGNPPETLEMLDDAPMPVDPVPSVRRHLLFLGSGIACLVVLFLLWFSQTRESPPPPPIQPVEPVSPRPAYSPLKLTVVLEGKNPALSAATVQEMRQFLDTIRGRPGKLFLEGYANVSAAEEKNRQLSEAGVQHVAQTFKDLGLDRSIRIYKIFYGGMISRSRAETGETQATPHRVEIRFIPQDGTQ